MTAFWACPVAMLLRRRLAQPTGGLRNGGRGAGSAGEFSARRSRSQPPYRNDRFAAGDVGGRPRVTVVERLGGGIPGDCMPEAVPGVQTRLHGDLGDAGELVQAHHVRGHVDLGMAGNGAVVVDQDAAGAVLLRIALGPGRRPRGGRSGSVPRSRRGNANSTRARSTFVIALSPFSVLTSGSGALAASGGCLVHGQPSRSIRWSPTRMAFALAVRAGLTGPMLGKKLVSTT